MQGIKEMSHLRLEIKISLDLRNRILSLIPECCDNMYTCVYSVKGHVVEITAFQYVGRDSGQSQWLK